MTKANTEKKTLQEGLLAHPVTRILEDQLRSMGVELDLARTEDETGITYYFVLDGCYSTFFRLYRIKSDELFLLAECGFGQASNSGAVALLLLDANGKHPFPVRLANSGNFLVAQFWCRANDQLNLRGLPTLIDLLIETAVLNCEALLGTPGFVPLSLDTAKNYHQVA